MIRLNKNIYLRIVSDAALVLEKDLKLVHPIVKQLFYKKVFQRVLGKGFHQAGKIKNFLQNWELITGDPDILALIKGFKILVLSQTIQDYVPRIRKMSKAQRKLVEAEIEAMLRKGTICQIHKKQVEFISLLFLAEKNDGGQHPVINLKNLNLFVSYEHFRMESLNLLQFLLEGEII